MSARGRNAGIRRSGGDCVKDGNLVDVERAGERRLFERYERGAAQFARAFFRPFFRATARAARLRPGHGISAFREAENAGESQGNGEYR